MRMYDTRKEISGNFISHNSQSFSIDSEIWWDDNEELLKIFQDQQTTEIKY